MDNVDRIMISRKDLVGLITDLADYTRHLLFSEPHTDLAPVLLVQACHAPYDFSPLRVCMPLHGDFNEHEEKAALLHLAGRALWEQRLVPQMVALASEAWYSIQRHDGTGFQGQPRDDPDRVEEIVIYGLSLDRKHHGLTMAGTSRLADRMLLAEPFAPVGTEGVECPLLVHFYEGFLATTAARMRRGRNA